MDLLYGHLGAPIYDAESKSWDFPRNSQSKRYFHPIIQLYEDTAVEQPALSGPGTQQHLLKAYPELGGNLSPEDARFSEIINNCTSQYDPKVSDSLAVGQAVDASLSKASPFTHYKTIIAITGGAAGELVRLIVSTKRQLKWTKSMSRKLESLTVENGEEGWWKGNGSPIQQLVFAGHEKEASSWLAIRYEGAISILQPTLQLDVTCPSNAEGQIRDLPPSRLDANHIITLTSQDAGGISFADVTFNPWDAQQFATIDQSCHWLIWNMKRQIKSHGLWTLEKISGGSFANDEDTDDSSSQINLDGWAKVLWVNDADSVVIASRRKIAMLQVKGEPNGFGMPDLGLENSPDWILDIRRSPINESDLLVVTSSRVFLLDTRPPRPSGNLHAAASTLISWIHFRSPDDISLSMSCFDITQRGDDSQKEKTTAVVLYSRLNSLASVFSFSHSNVTGHAISQVDPYFLPILGKSGLSAQSRSTRKKKHSLNGLLCLQMIPVSEKKTRMIQHHDVSEEPSGYFLLQVLYHDKSISEHLYAESGQKAQSLQPPDNQGLVSLKKTPSTVIDDFVVPDGAAQATEISLSRSEVFNSLNGMELPKRRKMIISGIDAAINSDDSRSLEMCWAMGVLDQKKRSLRSEAFASCLKLVQKAIDTKMRTTTSGAQTLLELSKADPLITDIDVAATTLSSLLDNVSRSPSDATKAAATAPASRAMVSTSLIPNIRVALGLDHELNLSQTHDNLIRSQIGTLPTDIPDRVRYALEKQLRTMAAQLCLAAPVVRVCVELPSPDKLAEQDVSTQDPTFTIPVRDKGPKSSRSNGNKEGSMRAPHTQPSAPFSGPSSFGLVPTSDSQGSIRSETPLESTTGEISAAKQSFSEDSSSINLRPLASLIPQPLLPQKISDNLSSDWILGEDPACYDWEAARRATARPDRDMIAAQKAREARAARKAQKRARFSTLVGNIGTKPLPRAPEGVAYSQPEPMRIVETSSQNVLASSSQMPESTQVGAVASTQPLAGKFAGGQKGLKGKKNRKSGF